MQETITEFRRDKQWWRVVAQHEDDELTILVQSTDLYSITPKGDDWHTMHEFEDVTIVDGYYPSESDIEDGLEAWVNGLEEDNEEGSEQSFNIWKWLFIVYLLSDIAVIAKRRFL